MADLNAALSTFILIFTDLTMPQKADDIHITLGTVKTLHKRWLGGGAR